MKLDDNISPLPPPRVAKSKSNVVVVANYGAINSLGWNLEKVEKFGTLNRIKIDHDSRQVGNGAKRPRPQATQPCAQRTKDKLRNKAKR